ncbi:MAG TPA: restriction endonuclease [Thermoanaerobaculia bacterium]|nr:restriction endonuclease [Thermoanaerobaculia bacterium]
MREAERQRTVAIRLSQAAEREAKRQYAEDRAEDARDRTAAAEEKIEALSRILEHALVVNDRIDFASLRVAETFAPFSPPPDLARPGLGPDKTAYVDAVPKPGRFAQLFSWVKRSYAEELASADRRYEEELARFRQRESERVATLAKARAAYESNRTEALRSAAERNREVGEFEAAYHAADPQAIVSHTTMVLERSVYPEGFPQQFRVAYVAASKEAVVDYQLPNATIVPSVAEFRYVKAKDAIEEKPRKKGEISTICQNVVAGVALRTIHEIMDSDQIRHFDVVTFSGFVEAVDPANGRDIRPYIISVRATRDAFDQIDLRRVDKRVCLRNLGAHVSSRPDELVAVRPIVEFDMVDRRFVEGSDVLSGLDSRPNIMDLTPFEFEHLVGNLFSHMGLDTRQTQASRDGGVDVVAFDTRPVVGGKVVIQAKRYRNTVGVAAVRDLYGTMINEGANKGILVSTSGYGADAFKFAKDKPIELIDGGGLLYLCEQAGVHARIIFPSEG